MAGLKVRINIIEDKATPHLRTLKPKIKSAINIGLHRIGGELREKSVPIAPYKSGTLRRGINYEVKGQSVEFGVNLKSIPYARIREFGGVIRAKNKPYLVFKVNGQWRKVRRVIQSGANGGKGYLRPSFERMRAGRAAKIFDEEIKYIINQ